LFIAKLNTTYQSTANTLSFRIIEIVEGITSDILKNPGTLVLFECLTSVDQWILVESNFDGLVFLGRATDMLSSSSSFIENINCSTETINGKLIAFQSKNLKMTSDKVFRERIASMNDEVLNFWRNITIRRIVHDVGPQLQGRPHTSGNEHESLVTMFFFLILVGRAVADSHSIIAISG